MTQQATIYRRTLKRRDTKRAKMQGRREVVEMVSDVMTPEEWMEEEDNGGSAGCYERDLGGFPETPDIEDVSEVVNAHPADFYNNIISWALQGKDGTFGGRTVMAENVVEAFSIEFDVAGIILYQLSLLGYCEPTDGTHDYGSTYRFFGTEEKLHEAWSFSSDAELFELISVRESQERNKRIFWD